MRINSLITIGFTFLLTLPTFLTFAQKVQKTSGQAQIRMENNMTFEQAQNHAEELAIIDAIEKVFGTYVEQQFEMDIDDGKTTYNIIGGTKIKGEWIETIDKEFKNYNQSEKDQFGEREVLYISCSITGKAREIVPKATIVSIPLNSPNKINRTYDFIDGEDFYLFFQSPVKGYLSVFIDDGNMVCRILPYTNMRLSEQNGVRIKSDKEYIFFSKEISEYKPHEVESIEVFTNKSIEYNYIYIVFSENPFIKPILNSPESQNNDSQLKSITLVKFQKWLEKNRGSSLSFQDSKIKIRIRAKE